MTIRISIAVTDGFSDGLQQLALDRRTTVSEVIRYAILTHPEFIYAMANFTSTNLPDEIGDRERAKVDNPYYVAPKAITYADWKRERRERDQAFRDAYKAQQKEQRRADRAAAKLLRK